MPDRSADTIRILVSSDNHVGYAEGDPVRTDDSWRTFDEILNIARVEDVDMVLLGGDLFHENHPSRKSMSEVVNSLSEHCQGDKPVELEMIGDQSEHFPGRMNRVNYMNPNLNISIPVFTIHGNHDDPTGPEHKSALDVLHDAGLLNYYGRVTQINDIHVKPLLMQKGTTKLALYGISNVRDERLFQTFRDHKVTFYSPTQAKEEWYNILSVHQNHTPHTDTSYLPESSLPSSMDMIVWGHEHECKILPRLNSEMGFKVMQPGSSIATSLIPGEAVPKEVAILNITGKECRIQTIRLKTVRPFVYRDIILREQKGMKEVAFKANNLPKVKNFCKAIIEEMIKEANNEWLASNPEYNPAEDTVPLPLIRLRVEYTAPEGGEYQVEQNQRFSQEYRDRVANVNDVIQFHRRRKATRRITAEADQPDDDLLEQLGLETIKIGDLIKEHLTVQSLTLLPQNLFSDAVDQFVHTTDKKVLDVFVADHLQTLVSNLLQEGTEGDDEEEEEEARMLSAITDIKSKQEERFRKGELRAAQAAGKFLPKPDDWDSDDNGHWLDQPHARIAEDNAATDKANDVPVAKGRGAAAKGTTATKKAAAGKTRTTTTKKAAAGKTKSKRKPFEEDSESAEPMLISDDDDDDESSRNDHSGGLFVSQESSVPARSAAKKTNGTRASAKSQLGKQSLKQIPLSFGSTIPSTSGRTSAASSRAAATRRQEPSDDEIDDDDDAFEPVVPVSRARRR